MHIRTSDCPQEPWKNGGGVTRVLLSYPHADDWQLRISVADITKDGAFSSFVGISRSFAVIEGAGVQLQLAGKWQNVTSESEVVVFDGSAAPDCKLMNGATRDLNVMCKHGHTATLTRAYAGEEQSSVGFFSKNDMTLYWREPAATQLTKNGTHIGWWIDFV